MSTKGTDQHITNNIALINISLSDRPSYTNGGFIPVFQRELEAVLSVDTLTDATIRILALIICRTDDANRINLTEKEIAAILHYSRSTVYKSLKELTAMQIICRKEGGSTKYSLSTRILNPRLAFKGNTKNLMKESLPRLMTPDGTRSLLPDTAFISIPDFLDDEKPDKR